MKLDFYFRSRSAQYKHVKRRINRIFATPRCRIFITARKLSLGQGNIFAPVCHSGGRYTPQAGTPPWAGTPPGRYIPQAGKPSGGTPLGRYTPQAGAPSKYTPRQVQPPGRYTPPGQVHPQAPNLLGNACWDTVNKRAVRILLECIFVTIKKFTIRTMLARQIFKYVAVEIVLNS